MRKTLIMLTADFRHCGEGIHVVDVIKLVGIVRPVVKPPILGRDTHCAKGQVRSLVSIEIIIMIGIDDAQWLIHVMNHWSRASTRTITLETRHRLGNNLHIVKGLGHRDDGIINGLAMIG